MRILKCLVLSSRLESSGFREGQQQNKRAFKGRTKAVLVVVSVLSRLLKRLDTNSACLFTKERKKDNFDFSCFLWLMMESGEYDVHRPCNRSITVTIHHDLTLAILVRFFFSFFLARNVILRRLLAICFQDRNFPIEKSAAAAAAVARP